MEGLSLLASCGGTAAAAKPGNLVGTRGGHRGYSCNLWGGDDSDQSDDSEAPQDELEAYLAEPQIKYKTEQDALDWWAVHAAKYPNVAVMARQYLGCPASSATVERLFSMVEMAFAPKRKSAKTDTLESIAFANANL